MSAYLTITYSTFEVACRMHERVPHCPHPMLPVIAGEEAGLSSVVCRFRTSGAAFTRQHYWVITLHRRADYRVTLRFVTLQIN